MQFITLGKLTFSVQNKYLLILLLLIASQSGEQKPIQLSSMHNTHTLLNYNSPFHKTSFTIAS